MNATVVAVVIVVVAVVVGGSIHLHTQNVFVVNVNVLERELLHAVREAHNSDRSMSTVY